MRGRNKPWAKDFIEEHRQLIYQKEIKADTLEIGIGKGDFIIQNAKNNPDLVHIGVEINTSILAMAMKKIVTENIENIYLLNVPAKDVSENIKEGSIQRIYLNFSDPWPQNGYRKRRLVHPLHLEIFESLLQDQGLLLFKTDNEKLFDFGVENFRQRNYEILSYSRDYQLEVGDFMSEYESKFRQQGQPIYRCVVKVNKQKLHSWEDKIK